MILQVGVSSKGSQKGVVDLYRLRGFRISGLEQFRVVEFRGARGTKGAHSHAIRSPNSVSQQAPQNAPSSTCVQTSAQIQALKPCKPEPETHTPEAYILEPTNPYNETPPLFYDPKLPHTGHISWSRRAGIGVSWRIYLFRWFGVGLGFRAWVWF